MIAHVHAIEHAHIDFHMRHARLVSRYVSLHPRDEVERDLDIFLIDLYGRRRVHLTTFSSMRVKEFRT